MMKNFVHNRREMMAGIATVALASTSSFGRSAFAQPMPPNFAMGGDTAAVGSALLRAQGGGAVTLEPGRTYRVGGRGWPGFVSGVRGTLVIEGNGATIALAARPRQGALPQVGAHVPSLFRFIGRGRVIVRNVNFLMNGIGATALAFEGVQVDVQNCSFANSGNRSQPAEEYGIMLFAVPAVTIANNRFTACGGAIYAGHTDPRFGSRNLTIQNNRASNLSGDFVVGVMANATIADNVVDGCYSGISISGFDRARAFSQRVTITRNEISNFRGHGVQTDVIGSGGKHGGRPRDIVIADNVLRSGRQSGSSALYLLNADGLTVRNNRASGVSYGLMLDESTAVEATGNVLEGNAAAQGPGIRIAGSRGGSLILAENSLSGFADGIVVTASGGVRLRGNRINARRQAVRADPTSLITNF